MKITKGTKAWCARFGHEFALGYMEIAPKAAVCFLCGAVRNGIPLPLVRENPPRPPVGER